MTAAIGRRAGELLGRTKRKDTIDAVVVTTANLLPRPVLILTSDPEDVGALSAEFRGLRVQVV